MSQYDGYELDYRASAAEAAASERTAFIQRVYLHLGGAILALVGVEAALLSYISQTGSTEAVLRTMVGSPWSWLVVMLLFMGAGFVARMWAQSRTSTALQYAGLALYICAWAVVFLPLLIVAQYVSARADGNPYLIPQAGILTGSVFAGLTLAAFITNKDFGFLGPILSVGSMIALGVIICACIFGFSLGLLFSFAMVALISGYILYDTSNVIRHYPTDMHVAASLELLADVAILFMYILQILMRLQSRD